MRVIVGVFRVVREAAVRAWSLRMVATWGAIWAQLFGFFLIADAAWRVSPALGLLVAGVLLVWLGNALEPEPGPKPGDQ